MRRQSYAESLDQMDQTIIFFANVRMPIAKKFFLNLKINYEIRIYVSNMKANSNFKKFTPLSEN